MLGSIGSISPWDRGAHILLQIPDQSLCQKRRAKHQQDRERQGRVEFFLPNPSFLICYSAFGSAI